MKYPKYTREDFINAQTSDEIVRNTSGLMKQGSKYVAYTSIYAIYNRNVVTYKFKASADTLINLLEMLATFESMFNGYSDNTTLSRFNWEKPHTTGIGNDIVFGCIFNDIPKMNHSVRMLSRYWDNMSNKEYEGLFYNDSARKREDIMYQIKLQFKNKEITLENISNVFDAFNTYFNGIGELKSIK